MLVLLRHSWTGAFPGAGVVGVVMFFVLSGYLITGILIRDIATCGRVRYRVFYAHRAFRLLPALLAFLLVYTATELITDRLGDRSTGVIGRTVVVGLLYVKDVPLPFDVSQAIAPLWTLAVEEQFYLIWPLMLVAAVRRARLRQLFVASSICVLAAMLVSVLAIEALRPERLNHVYSLPTTWGFGLIAGSWLRIHHDAATNWLHGRRGVSVTLLAVASLVVLSFYPDAEFDPLFYIVGCPAIVLASAVVVLRAASMPQPSSRLVVPLVRLGTISYAVYLWNYYVLLLLNDGTTAAPEWWVSVSAVVLTVVIATASWFTVEWIGRHMRRIFDARYVDRRGQVHERVTPSPGA